jgi:hypothetical protein
VVNVQPSTTAGASAGSGLAARAGADQTIYLSDGIDRVTLDGTTSTNGGSVITKYTWTKVSGPSASLYVFGTGKTYAAHLTEGTYVFRLTITSSSGATATDDITVHVIRTRGGTAASTGNEAPVARAGTDRTIYLSQGVNRVTLDATASSDPDGSIVKYVWAKKSGPAADLYTFATGRTYAAHLLKGTYSFAITVTDNRGATATDNLVVYVKN